MKKVTIFLLFLLIPLFIFSGNIDKEKNRSYAITAFQQKTNHVFSTKSTFEIKNIQYVTDLKDTIMAIYNFFPEGFIIMSTNDVSFPIIGYSDKGSFDMDKVAPSAKFIINEYKEEIKSAKVAPNYNYERIRNAWEKLESKQIKGTTIVQPLISAIWNQDKYYNQLSPIDFSSPNGYDNKVPNGCVAVAMGMIMYYYRYPESGSGSKTNSTNYGNFTVNFSEQSYNYDLMLDKLTYYNYEVAKLIFHAATSVSMNYSPDGSGAFSEDVPGAFKSYFKYDNEARRVYRNSYSDKNWHNLLIQQLNQKRPVYYSGSDSEGGHAFVCDGYDSDTLFHFNFGWGGVGNGYFVANSTNSSAGGYYRNQAAVIDIFPKNLTPQGCNDKLITAYSGTLEDGSGIDHYANNLECTYIIAPPYATSFDINIQSLSTEAGHDSLSFWVGHPANGNLVASYSGSYSNQNLTIVADSLYITFHTNDNTTEDGWRLSYLVNHDNSTCSYSDLFTSHSGTFSDRTRNSAEYGPNSECEWIIRPISPFAENITVSFLELDIAPNDILTIANTYDQKVVYATYTGTNTIPSVATYPTARLTITLSTDNYLQAKGFTIKWWDNTTTDISDYDTDNTNITVFPNPASNYINLLFDDLAYGVWTISLYDIAGKQLTFETISMAERRSMEINTADLHSGMYFLRCTNGQNIVTKKVIIQK